MVDSFNGFWYPVIDRTFCNDCNLCREVCPWGHEESLLPSDAQPVVYAARTTDSIILSESTSGGIFTELSLPVIEAGGVVYGAVLNADWRVLHVSAEKVAQLKEMRGSKYVQSAIGETYKEALAFLKNGRPVLFSGTPCQVAGLRSFLNRDFDNLYTVDLICHGVLAPYVLQCHVAALERENNSRALRVSFRDKRNGWKKSESFSVTFENGSEYLRGGKDDRFYNMFLSNYDLRECCYQCPFTSISRVSDITLGDFWGIEKSKPHLFDDRGYSMVLLNTRKGERQFHEISKRIVSVKSQVVDSDQPNLRKPTEPDIWRTRYLRSVRSHGLDYAIEHFSKPRPLWKKGIRYFQRWSRRLF